VALTPGSAGDARGDRVFQGDVRFFGMNSKGTLFFDSLGLSRARFVIDDASPHSQSYVEDELRRQGYTRSCRRVDATGRSCTWSGRTRVELDFEANVIRAEVLALRATEPAPLAAGPGEPPDASGRDSTQRAATAPAADTAFHEIADTLTLAGGGPRGRPAPRVLSAPVPSYPEVARRASVQGVVIVVARVDTAGSVSQAHIQRGVRELDEAALAAVRRYRFAPYRDERGRPARFWVTIPVAFLLH
jgi:TonB family protein